MRALTARLGPVATACNLRLDLAADERARAV